MARLPNPGSDSGSWGSILNDYLLQAHEANGALKSNIITNTKIADGAISEAKLDSGVQAKLSAVAPVQSVNTQTGTILLDADDISDNSTTHKFVTAADIARLAQTTGTNTGDQDLSGLVAKTTTVNGHALSGNITVSKADVGLSNVPNADATSRSSHTGTQTSGTISDFNSATDARIAAAVLNDLSNVNTTIVSDGQVLAYNAGSSTWTPTTAGSGVTDHGALTGLSDDDHPHYLNNSRGDARYYTKSQSDASIATKSPFQYTQLLTNPTFTTNTSGWQVYGTAALSRDTVDFNTTPASLLVSVSTSGHTGAFAFAPNDVMLRNNATFGGNAWVKATAGSTCSIGARLYTATGIYFAESSNQFTATGGWQQVFFTYTNTSGQPLRMGVQVLKINANNGDELRIDSASIGTVSDVDNINVRDFGAVLDGTVDDTAAVQAALDYANARGGGRVFLPKGTALVTGLTLYSKIYLQGAGVGSSIIRLADGANTNVITSYDYAALSPTGTSSGGIHSFQIRDLAIDGNSGNNTTGHGVAIYGYGFRIDNIMVHHCAQDGIRTEWAADASPPTPHSMEAAISFSKVHHCGERGFHIMGPHDSTVTACQVYMCSHGFYTEPNAAPLYFVSCHAWGTTKETWYLRAESHLANCCGEGTGTDASLAQVQINANDCSIIGGNYYGSSTGKIGFKIGSDTYANIAGTQIVTKVLNCTTATVWFHSDGGSSLIDILAYNSGAMSGTRHPSTRVAGIDAGSTTKGLIQLAGDLGGTAASPTVNFANDTLHTLKTKRISTLTPIGSTYTPNTDTTDISIIGSPTTSFTVANPTGTPVDGQTFCMRIRSGATGYAPTWGTGYASGGSNTLPSTALTASRTVLLEFTYDAQPAKWILTNYDSGYIHS